MKNYKKVVIVSLTYNSKGHSKSYIDNFFQYLNPYYSLELYCYGKPAEIIPEFQYDYCQGESKLLDYDSKQWFPTFRKVIRRFIVSIKFYYRLYNKYKNANCIFYFMDYEYISLSIFIRIFRNKKKVILLHSVSESKNLVKKIYKKISFKFISNTKNVFFVVNGDLAKRIFCNYSHNVNVIQYPTEIRHDFSKLSKEDSKKLLGIEIDRKIISLLGMIRRDKNYYNALKIFSESKLCNDSKNILLIAGFPSNVSEAELLSWLKYFNIKNYILIVRYLTEYDLHICFSATDYILIPYGRFGTSQSGPLSQAREYKIPAICWREGEIGEYVLRSNVGITFSNHEELLQIFNGIEILTNEFSFDETIYKYSWTNASKKYCKLFNDIYDLNS